MQVIFMEEEQMHLEGIVFLIDTGNVPKCTITVASQSEVMYCFIPKISGEYLRTWYIHEKSIFRGSAVLIGDVAHRAEIHVDGDEASVAYNALALAGNTARMTVDAIAYVDAPYRSVQVRVDAVYILLGSGASVRGIPQLFVATDDILGGHSCKIHRMENDALFYLQAHGLTNSSAEGLLLQGEIMRHLHTLPESMKGSVYSELHQRIFPKK